MSSVNKLGLYFGEDTVINEHIRVRSPLMKDLIFMGEDRYYSTLTAFTAIPTDMKVQLWDMGLNWEEVDDFEFFCMLTKDIPLEDSKVFLGDLDFTKFELGRNTQNNELVLFQNNSKGELIVIDRHIQMLIADTLRTMHGIVSKPRKAGSNTVRKLLIEDERMRMKLNASKQKDSTLFSMISSLVNCQEFKYGPKEIQNMTVYAFFDSVHRVSIVKNADALLKGCYSGMIDTKKINKNDLNWMREY